LEKKFEKRGERAKKEGSIWEDFLSSKKGKERGWSFEKEAPLQLGKKGLR